MIRIGREALRCLLARRGITFQRTKTWKESPDPEPDAKLDRIEEVLERFADRVFAFDEFGPLGIRPNRRADWAPAGHPGRHPATYHRTHGVRYFHGCYSVGDDRLWGVNRRKKGAVNTLAALMSIRAARPDGAPIYVILDTCPPTRATRSAAGRRRTASSCASPDLRLLGQPDRSPFRATAAVHDRQLQPPQPQRADPGPTRLPALAEQQHPPPRHHRGAASRTCPRPKREGHPLGRTSLAVAT